MKTIKYVDVELLYYDAKSERDKRVEYWGDLNVVSNGFVLFWWDRRNKWWSGL